MKIKRNTNYLLYRIVLTHILTLILFLGQKLNFGTILLIWFVTAVLPNFVLSFGKNLKAVEIQNDKNICLIFNKYFKEVKEFYDCNSLKFTYQTETGTRGAKSMEFRIYKKDSERSMISIGGFFDGWTDDKISEIIEELNKIEIKVIE